MIPADGAVDLEAAWAVLSRPTAGGQPLNAYPLTIAGDLQVGKVALDRDGWRHLLLRIDGESLSADARPSALGVTTRHLAFGGESALYLDLMCADPDLNAEFDDVVSDVLEAAAGSPKPGAAALEVVARWRRLFRHKLSAGLSSQAKRGLFAELSVLHSLLTANPTFDVGAWRGPLREPHDFEAPTHCLEVKALSEESVCVQIHGLQQLDQHDGRPLVLVLATVTPDAEGVTIGELVDEILSLTKDPATFRSRLGATGWALGASPPDSDAFVIEQVRTMRVGPDVPKLVGGSLVAGVLPEGVGEVRYTIDCAALFPFAQAETLSSLGKAAVQ